MDKNQYGVLNKKKFVFANLTFLLFTNTQFTANTLFKYIITQVAISFYLDFYKMIEMF